MKPRMVNCGLFQQFIWKSPQGTFHVKVDEEEWVNSEKYKYIFTIVQYYKPNSQATARFDLGPIPRDEPYVQAFICEMLEIQAHDLGMIDAIFCHQVDHQSFLGKYGNFQGVMERQRQIILTDDQIKNSVIFLQNRMRMLMILAKKARMAKKHILCEY